MVDIWSEEEKKIARGKMAAGKTGIKKPKIGKKKIVYKHTYRNEYIEICEKLSTKKHNIIEDSEILFCRRMDELLAAGSNKETSKTIYID